MRTYLIYKDGKVILVTTMPRIVQDHFKLGANNVDLWIADKRIRTFNSLVEFNRFINPPRTEDDEEVTANNNEW